MSFLIPNKYGFEWGPVTVTRLASFSPKAGRGRYYMVEVRSVHHTLTIHVSPTGRSVRVFKGGKELL